MLAALADVTVKISRRVTRHSPRGQAQDADHSVSLYRQRLLLLGVSVLRSLGTVGIWTGGFLVLGVVVCI